MMLGYVLAGFTMMRLGPFAFGIRTAAYQDLKRSTEWKWPNLERFGQLDALQYTGPGSETITLNGVILTEYRGGLGQLERLRILGGEGKPQLLVSGLGEIMGTWVIEWVDEGQSVFAAAGLPRRQEFTVQLRRHDY